MGAICGGATNQQIECLSRYGLKIGLGFQIADDILDISASSEQLGKTAGKDKKAAKCTYPAVVGIHKARQLERDLANEAIAALEPPGRFRPPQTLASPLRAEQTSWAHARRAHTAISVLKTPIPRTHARDLPALGAPET